MAKKGLMGVWKSGAYRIEFPGGIPHGAASMSRNFPFLPRNARAAFLGLALAASWTQAGELRVWTSADGKTVTAEMISATDTTVTIKSDAGREFTLAHERLSAADKEFVRTHLAEKKAALESMEWPSPTAERSIKAAYFKRLHSVDPKKFSATYTGKIVLIEGQVIDVKEDRMASSQGVIVVLETEDKVPVEFRFSKSSYDKDLSLLVGSNYDRYRGPYSEDEFRVSVVEKSLVVERRYVIERDSYYTSMGNYRYRYRWSDWKAVSKPLVRGDMVKIRGEFSSVFNSAMTFKDACMMDPLPAIDRTLLR